MNATDDFIAHGLEQARYALLNVRNLTDMVRAPLTLRRGTAQRARARLKLLEVIVRRLVLLLALSLRLAPVRPRAPGPATPLPHGVEDVTHTYPALAAPRRLRLAGRAVDPCSASPFGLFPCAFRTGPVPAAPVFARIIALHRVLVAPEAHARRLARTLDRLKRKGEPRPSCLPVTGAYRLRPELGLVASALPGLVNAGLESWPEWRNDTS
tara:strand:- start:184 stop:816 length:633 start_codon:yes stop_codon:yes gene_type:complete